MSAKKNYKSLLEEMLKLADVPLNEQDDDEEEKVDDEEEEKDSEAEDDTDDSPEAELEDEWEKQIKTGSTLRIQFHANYIYVWYRNKRSNRIVIPSKLRQHRDLISKLIEQILAFVEKTS